jgi:LEA14-like dessication related protein
MTQRTRMTITLALVGALSLSACVGLQRSDPLEVAVAGIEPMQGEGLELRMLVSLRVQNPNDAPLDYDGVYVRLEVQDKTFATGVSDARGSVPRFGESVIEVPVTVSMLRLVRQALGMFDGEPADKVSYRLTGKLSGPGFGARRFQAEGELGLPSGPVPEGESAL